MPDYDFSQCVEMLDELLAYDGDSGKRSLTDWEMTYLDSINRQRMKGWFSDKQRKKLAEIWHEVF